ncbi:MAG: hypothetical protein K0S74_1011 [Chlamydiales bacterium]|jgi:hypothetical protein|nr:hypothetical protein [Chlamydiales bacterium]
METENKLKNIVEALNNLEIIIKLNPKKVSFDIPEFVEENSYEEKEPETTSYVSENELDKRIDTAQTSIKVLFEHFRNFYLPHQKAEYQHRKFEHISSVMGIVEQAITSLDNCTVTPSQGDVPSLIPLSQKIKSYQQLKQFYLNKFPKYKPRKSLGNIQQESGEVQVDLLEEKFDETKELSEGQKIQNLQIVREDLHYELFYMRKGDGAFFFNKQLEKSIKLLCLFSEDLQGHHGDDPLIQIPNWKDEFVHRYAKQLFDSCYELISIFFKETKEMRKFELFNLMSSALMALMLSANPLNLSRNGPVKSAARYFYDFQCYLRCIFESNTYKVLEEHEEHADNKKAVAITSRLLKALCQKLYTQQLPQQFLLSVIEGMVFPHLREQHRSLTSSRRESSLSLLVQYHQALRHILNLHPSGPLFKALDFFIDIPQDGFDPFLLGCFPGKIYGIDLGEIACDVLRVPSPTRQTTLEDVEITPEFKAFLGSHSNSLQTYKHVLFNLQDRTHWREHSRCIVLEKLPLHAQYAKELTVVTLAYHTDFYKQRGEYSNLIQPEDFIKQLRKQLISEETGYAFPPGMRKIILSDFTSQLIKEVYEFFFENKKTLAVEERQDFIELIYLFIQLKVLDLFTPQSISFTCKDGIDNGSAASSLFLIFYKFLSRQQLTSEDHTQLYLNLFIPALLQRERLMQPEVFEKTIRVAKRIELKAQELGPDRFYDYITEKFSYLYSDNLFSKTYNTSQKSTALIGNKQRNKVAHS